MPGRIIEISTNGRSLHLDRGFLSVREGDAVVGRVPVDDVDAVIASVQGVTWSNKALAALSERGATVVIIGADFNPSAAFIPLRGHHDQGRRMRAQADASAPMRKRLWAEIVRAKLAAQAAALETIGQPAERVKRLRAEVRSGDPTNREAAAAQAYWPLLMGADFRRDRAGDAANAMLNYGYAVLRSAAARAIVAAGLHPSLSLHHVSDGDALRLADDLMEPFRPAVDLLARDLSLEGAVMGDASTRKRLASVLEADYRTANGRSPLSQALVRLSQSLAAIFLGD
ncbi:MAG: type II CRISPR-associated endonuclease Cas1, partial [Amphiplicatus sp.]